MFQHFPQSRQAIIAASGSLSAACELSGLIVGVIVPSTWSAAALTFQASNDGLTFYDVYDKTGAEYTVTAVAGHYVPIPSQDFAGAAQIKARSGSGATVDFYRQYITLLQFLEDTLDASKVSVAVGTMTYPTPNFTGISISQFGSKDHNYRMAIACVRMLAQRFSWLKLADHYAVMSSYPSYTYPNATGNTSDIHPNDAGHNAIAIEFDRALGSTTPGLY